MFGAGLNCVATWTEAVRASMRRIHCSRCEGIRSYCWSSKWPIPTHTRFPVHPLSELRGRRLPWDAGSPHCPSAVTIAQLMCHCDVYHCVVPLHCAIVCLFFSSLFPVSDPQHHVHQIYQTPFASRDSCLELSYLVRYLIHHCLELAP